MTSTDEKPANFATNWFRYLLAFLIALAVGTYLYGILGGSITVDRRLDTTSIVLIIVAAGLVFLIIDPSAIEGLTSITFGSFKAEFAQLRRQQEVQQRQVDSMSAVLALLLTDEEQAPLLRWRRGQTPQQWEPRIAYTAAKTSRYAPTTDENRSGRKNHDDQRHGRR